MADEKENEKKPKKKLSAQEIKKKRARFVARAEDLRGFATKEEALEASSKRQAEIEAFKLQRLREVEARRKAKALEDPENEGRNEVGAFKQQLLCEAEARRQEKALEDQQNNEESEENKQLPGESED